MSSTLLKPLGERVIVRVAEQEEKTSGGILLPQTANKEKPQEGEVLAVGPGKLLDNGDFGKMSVRQGDRVVFAKYAGTEVKLQGEEVLVISEKDILAIIEQ